MNKEFNTKYQTREVELREANVKDDNGKMILEGYASVFNSPTVLWREGDIEYKEVIDNEAFSGADLSDCCLKYNHVGAVHARVRGGSLKLEVDNVGLKFHAELIDTTDSTDLYKRVKNGLIDKCSFAFSVKEYEFDVETYTRTIKKIAKLYDVAVVDTPAYKDTSVSARGAFEMEIEKVKTELENQERDRLIIETYL
jgi:hypothetical protein